MLGGRTLCRRRWRPSPTATDDDTIKRLDARTGAYLGTLVPPDSDDDLIGPAGLVVRGQDLYVANQNTFQPLPSSVLRYSAVTGALLQRVVPAQIGGKDNRDAPFASRGMVLWSDSNLFVASFAGNNNGTPGEVLKYTLTGTLVAPLPRPPFPFHPRGVVVGPDQKLYVSNVQNFPAGNGGQVLRYSPASGSLLDVFISNDVSPQGKLRTPKGDCTDNLNRPEGLVFGPDGNLYITSFRAGVSDIDRILIFAGPQHARPGTCLGSIGLDEEGNPRSFAQALLFGPGGVLFVPIANLVTGQSVQDLGAIRRYEVGGSNFPGRRLCQTLYHRPQSVR